MYLHLPAHLVAPWMPLAVRKRPPWYAAGNAADPSVRSETGVLPGPRRLQWGAVLADGFVHPEPFSPAVTPLSEVGSTYNISRVKETFPAILH